MSKLQRLMLVCCCLTGATIPLAAYSQPDFLKPKQSTQPSASQVTVSSPEQFQSSVKNLDKKTQDSLKAQIKNSLTTPPLSNSSSTQVSVPQHTTAQPSGEEPATADHSPPPPVAETPTETPPAPPPPPPATLNAAPLPSQESQTYTGFGPSNTKTGNPPPSSSGGGLNIKY